MTRYIPKNLAAAFAELDGVGDRAVILALVSLLDHALAEAIMSRLREPQTDSEWRLLFSPRWWPSQHLQPEDHAGLLLKNHWTGDATRFRSDAQNAKCGSSRYELNIVRWHARDQQSRPTAC